MGHWIFNRSYKTVGNKKGFHCGSQVDQNNTDNEYSVRIGKLREISLFRDELNEGL